MSGDDAGRGEEDGRPLPPVDRRRYVRSICAAGAAGILGAGATGLGSAQTNEPPAPRGLHVASLEADAVALAWYHRDDVSDARVAERYRVFVDGAAASSVAAPGAEEGPADARAKVTLTVSDLDPATTREFGVRAVNADGVRSDASTVTATTLDPSAIGQHDVTTVRTETDSPRNWITVTTLDHAHREVRVRGGLAPGGTCGRASVSELRYDEAADELHVVVEAAPDGSQVCPAVEGELVYEVTATVARPPETVVVEHAGVDWRDSKLVLGPDPNAPLRADVEHPALDVGDVRTATMALGAEPPEGSATYDLTVEVDDPSVAAITAADSDVLDRHEDAERSIADDGSRLRWTSPAVTRSLLEENGPGIASVDVEGVGTGVSGLTVHVERRGDGSDGATWTTGTDDLLRVDTRPEHQDLFAEDRTRTAVTFGFQGHVTEANEYVVSVDGETVSRLAGSELTDLRRSRNPGNYYGTTVDGLDPGTAYEIGLEERTPDGETGSNRTATLETLPAAGIEGYEFATSKGFFRRPELRHRGEVSVGADRRRVSVAGAFWFPSVPHTLRLGELRFDDGTLHLSVLRTGGGGSEAVDEIGFSGAVRLDRPVDRVVMEYPDRGYRRIWEGDLGGDYERLRPVLASSVVDRGERTEVSLRLDGLRPVLSEYQVTVALGDADVARFVDASLSDRAEREPTVEDHRVEATFDHDPEKHDGTGPVDLGTLVLEGVEAGSTTVEYAVLERYRGGKSGMAGRLEPVLTVADAGTPRPATTTAPGTPGRVGENTALPADPDADGLYEDVNGNGREDIADAVDLFRHRSEADPEFFDFTESGGVSIGDAVSLFRENTR